MINYDICYSYIKGYEYFVHDPGGDGMSFFKTEEERDKYVTNVIIPSYLDHDGWYEEVKEIVVGKVTHNVIECDKEEPVGSIDEEGYDEDGDWWGTDTDFRCNFKLQEVTNN